MKLKKPLILYLGVFLFLFLLELNYVGLSIRDKIVIENSLDFSWFSDAIERLLHGYLLGKDATFTYGPLFQIIYALPSILFHVPSYISVALSPLVSYILIFFMSLLIARLLTKNIYEQITYVLFVFIILGLLISNGSDTVRMLVPIVYGLSIYKVLTRKYIFIQILLLSLIPTIVGLYTYNLFITCFLIAVIFTGIKYFRSPKKTFSVNKYLLIIPFILVSQIVFSLIFTHNFDYIFYSFDSLRNYRYVMNLTWTADRANVLLIFPAVLILLLYFFRKTKLIAANQRTTIAVIIFVSLIQLIYAVSRSDAGHLLYALYPSIFAFYTLVFFLALKSRWIILLGIALYVLVPYKPSFYNILGPNNVKEVFRILKEKPSFFEIYSFSPNYYFSEKELKKIRQIVNNEKKAVYLYPYDSFILNTLNRTYNAFALGMYTYSNSPVELRTLEGLKADTPRLIVLSVDTKGAVNLDDIPNFTRNPLIAEWMIKNYSVKQTTQKYIVLTYSPEKNNKQKNKLCQAYWVDVDLTKKENFLEKTFSLIKPPLYYWGNIRLPFSPDKHSYLLFNDVYSKQGVTTLFTQDKKEGEPFLRQDQPLEITRVSPFLRKKTKQIYSKNEYNSKCLY